MRSDVIAFAAFASFSETSPPPGPAAACDFFQASIDLSAVFCAFIQDVPKKCSPSWVRSAADDRSLTFSRIVSNCCSMGIFRNAMKFSLSLSTIASPPSIAENMVERNEFIVLPNSSRETSLCSRA